MLLPQFAVPLPSSSSEERLSFIRGEFLWQPVFNFPPGHHVTADGSYDVVPPGTESRYFRFTIGNNEKLMTLLNLDGGPITRPLRVKRTWPTSPRFTEVTMDAGSVIPVDYIFLPRDGGPIRIASQGREIVPKSSIFESFYERGRRRKVLTRLTLRDERPTGDIHLMLLRFKKLYAVDTNTYMHPAGARVWITSILEGSLTPVVGDQLLLQSQHHSTFLTKESSGSAEIAGWVGAISRLLQHDDAPVERIGLIVDAHKGQHDNWNDRTQALLGDLFLPPGWQLIFATSDAASHEFFPNTMIASCHKAANLAFCKVKNAPLPF